MTGLSTVIFSFSKRAVKYCEPMGHKCTFIGFCFLYNKLKTLGFLPSVKKGRHLLKYLTHWGFDKRMSNKVRRELE